MRLNWSVRFFCLIGVVALSACGQDSKRVSDEPLQVVSNFDLDSYLGRWYEIARFPFAIQETCHNTTATYASLSNGKIQVINECRKGGFEGELSRAEAKAWIEDPQEPAKLKVSFNFFMSLFGGADYWVIQLDEDNYEWAVVSEPEGRYLWILSRKAEMPTEQYEGIVESLKEDGFLVEYLQKTPQSWDE